MILNVTFDGNFEVPESRPKSTQECKVYFSAKGKKTSLIKAYQGRGIFAKKSR